MQNTSACGCRSAASTLDVMVGMSGAVEAGGETGWRGHHKRNGDGLGQGVGAQ